MNNEDPKTTESFISELLIDKYVQEIKHMQFLNFQINELQKAKSMICNSIREDYKPQEDKMGKELYAIKKADGKYYQGEHKFGSLHKAKFYDNELIAKARANNVPESKVVKIEIREEE